MKPKFKEGDIITVKGGEYSGRIGKIQKVLPTEHKGKIVAIEYLINLNEPPSSGRIVTLDENFLQ